MNTVTLEIPAALSLKLLEAASKRGASARQLLSEALEEYLAREEQFPATASFAQLAAAILDTPGDETSPADLSTNKTHLEGYGQC